LPARARWNNSIDEWRGPGKLSGELH